MCLKKNMSLTACSIMRRTAGDLGCTEGERTEMPPPATLFCRTPARRRGGAGGQARAGVRRGRARAAPAATRDPYAPAAAPDPYARREPYCHATSYGVAPQKLAAPAPAAPARAPLEIPAYRGGAPAQPAQPAPAAQPRGTSLEIPAFRGAPAAARPPATASYQGQPLPLRY